MVDLRDATPAERHRTIAGTFTDRVLGTSNWDAEAPVAGWTARDVVGHLTTWFPGFLAGGTGIELPGGDGAHRDPIGTWRTQAHAIQAVLDDPQTAQRQFSNPHTGTLPLPDAIDRFYTVDVFMHTWDLARATGQDDALDAGLCDVLLAGMEPIEDMMRGSGQYGPRVPVADDADAQTRLLGFIGRDPAWRPRNGSTD